MSARGTRAITASLLLLALAACEVGPNFERPPPPQVAAYTPGAAPAQTSSANAPGGVAQSFETGLDVAGEWWTAYRSPALNALVAQALKANPDVEAAQAALRGAREAYFAQQGALWPTVDASYNATGQKTSATIAPLLASNAELFSLHTAQLTVGYTPDVFGGVRRQIETNEAQAEAQRFQIEATYLALTSNLVAAAIQAAMLRDQIDATQKLIQADAEVLEMMRRQYARGELASADVAGQTAILAQAQQALPPLQKQLAQQNDLIADLTGQYPSEASPPAISLADLTLPADLPLSLPSKLVDQRPDVRAAEANLHAASAQVGVAIANRLPNITLSANAGGQATNIAALFSNGNTFWTLSGTIAQPIFEGGALLHRQRGAEAALDQAKAQYRSTVLSAFQNVADTLQALMSDASLLQTAAAGEDADLRGLDITRQQFVGGEAGAMAVLNAEATYRQAVSTRLAAEANRYADTAALFVALGGGWWNRAETAATTPADDVKIR